MAPASTATSMNIKIVFAGSANVGKTALFQKWKTNETLDETEATIGIDFERRKIQIPAAGEGSDQGIVGLTVWDTAGQEKFRSVSSHHYRGTHGALLVYDVSLGESLDDLRQKWQREVADHAVPNAAIAVVANKADLLEDEISIGKSNLQEGLKAGREFAAQQKCLFFETSSKWDRVYFDHTFAKTLDYGEERLYRCGIEVVLRILAEEVLAAERAGTLITSSRGRGNIELLPLTSVVGCNDELLKACAC
ncbi:unnamed protein product [Amoebophrya sp. A25]|nr:unnamed protein product [Amoebophrya sp. A25]|eukprot:GSA25T00002189001.1